MSIKLKNIIKNYFSKSSVKENEMNRILEKISKKEIISNKDLNFLNSYQITTDDDLKDYVYLSKNSTFTKVSQLIERGKRVICDLHDKDGKIGMEIIKIENQFESEKCILTLKKGNTFFIQDKFLYNIIYNLKKDEYSLQEQGEYFEKINTTQR